jgi:hypothetical protein
MKWLTIIVALVLGGAAAAMFVRVNSQSQELKALRESNEALKAEVAQHAETSATRTQADRAELERLRKDNAELLRLRSEIRQLRGEKEGLSQQAARAAQQAEAAHAAQEQLRAQVAQTAIAVQQASNQLASAGANSAAVTCAHHLRLLDAAIQQWALEGQLRAGAPVVWDQVKAYLKNPEQIICPGGGVYTMGPVGQPTACSIGHRAQ